MCALHAWRAVWQCRAERTAAAEPQRCCWCPAGGAAALSSSSCCCSMLRIEGHIGLLTDLLATPGVAVDIQIQWRAGVLAETHVLWPALRVAVCNDQLAAMHTLLGVLDSSGASKMVMHTPFELMRLMGLADRQGSKACARALLHVIIGRGAGPQAAQELKTAARFGDAAAVDKIMAHLTNPTWQNTVRDAFFVAAQHGHVHLLMLLGLKTPPAEDMWGVLVCEKAEAVVQSAEVVLQTGEDFLLKFLLNAMQAVKSVPRYETHWLHTIKTCFRWSCGNDGAVAWHFMWQVFEHSAETAVLAACAEYCLEHDMTWNRTDDGLLFVYQFVLPRLQDFLPQQHFAKVWQLVAFRMVQQGDETMIRLIDRADSTAMLVRSHAEWQLAKVQGMLTYCIRRGDVAAVSALVQNSNLHWPADQRAYALHCAAELTDPTIAEAVIRALMPLLTHERVAQHPDDMPDMVFIAHGGLIFRLLFECSPAVRSAALLSDADEDASYKWSSIGHDFLQRACEAGHLELAEWLVRHAGQHPACLSTFYMHNINYEGLTTTFTLRRNSPRTSRRTFTQLLHRLAMAPPGDELASSTAGSDGDDGGRHADGASGISSSSKGGASNTNQPPAGARRLTEGLLSHVLEKDGPDMLYALLVFMDCWG